MDTAQQYRNPIPTIDIIISWQDRGIILIKRKNKPLGWAIPGGFVDYGESLETAARREAKEETGLDVTLIRQFHTYSEPTRDERFHTVSTVFLARAEGQPQAGDDALDYGVFSEQNLPHPLVFDHALILDDFFNNRY